MIEIELRRDDRDLAFPVLAQTTGNQLRTAISKTRRASGVPLFSPRDLRHRRVSLLDRQGVSWTDIGEAVAPSNRPGPTRTS